MPRSPKYCRHKGSGQAYITLNGQEVYLGCYGSPESQETCDRLIVNWRQQNDQLGKYSLSVGQLYLKFLEFAADYYRNPEGEPTTELRGFLEAPSSRCV